MDVLKEIGGRIKDKREKLGISQKELGKDVGYSQEAIAKFETGERHIEEEKLGKIAELLHTSRYYLLTGISDENAGIASETGLSNEAINYLKRAKSSLRVLWGYKEITPINAFLGTKQGQELIDEIWLFLQTDFSKFSARTSENEDVDNVKEISVWVPDEKKDVYYLSTIPPRIPTTALMQAFIDDITEKIKAWKEDIATENNQIVPRRGRKKKGVDNAPKE